MILRMRGIELGASEDDGFWQEQGGALEEMLQFLFKFLPPPNHPPHACMFVAGASFNRSVAGFKSLPPASLNWISTSSAPCLFLPPALLN